MQYTSTLLMIEPVQFGFNAQTAVNNSFQQETGNDIQTQASKEFNSFAEILRNNKINVIVIKDSPHPHTPDSVFPNNWISFHKDNSIVLYPMFAANRRMERKQEIIDSINDKFIIEKVYDLTNHENNNQFLEGTGSMVLDRENRIAYACLSPRTDLNLLHEFCHLKGYQPVSFVATAGDKQAIYHTNVLMCIADDFAVICLESIRDEKEKESVIHSLRSTNKEIIPITIQQMHSFAGNMLQVINRDREKLVVMSTQAYNSLNEEQLSSIPKNNRIVHSGLDNIELAGGGSARCMLAEIFLTPV